MINKIKQNADLIFFILLYTLGIQIITHSLLLSKSQEMMNTGITNINKFLTIITILIAVLAILFIFIQSVFYKLFLILFQPEKNITITQNFSHLLKGTIPLVTFILIFTLFFKEKNIYNVINLPMVKIINALVTNFIYVYFLKRNVELSNSKIFILGSMLIIFNLLFIFIGQLMSN